FLSCVQYRCITVSFFKAPATTELYTLSLHDALPISEDAAPGRPAGSAERITAAAHADSQGNAPCHARRRLRRRAHLPVPAAGLSLRLVVGDHGAQGPCHRQLPRSRSAGRAGEVRHEVLHRRHPPCRLGHAGVLQAGDWLSSKKVEERRQKTCSSAFLIARRLRSIPRKEEGRRAASPFSLPTCRNTRSPGPEHPGGAG